MGENPEGKDGFKETRISGKIDPRGKIIASTYMRGIPDKGEAAEEYRQVYAEYQKAVRESLTREEIPMGYKETVRRYFESVCPKENE